MRPLVFFSAVCLISFTAFAQRGGHAGGGSHSGGGSFHGGGGMSHSGGFSRGGGVASRGGSWNRGGYRGGGYHGGYHGGYGYRNSGFARGRYWYPYYGLGWATYGYGWDPYFWGWGDSYSPSYNYSQDYSAGSYYEPQPPVIVNQAMPYPEPAPPPAPVIHEYVNTPPSPAAQDSPVLYLIALKNTSIVAALTYWTEKGELHYINLDHQTKQIPLSSIDRELTDRLGRERNVTVKLPG